MQTIYLDISNKGVIPTIYAKQGDVGRRFLAILTDAGVPYSPPAGSAFSVWYDGDSGDGNYTGVGGASAFVVNANTVSVELITQMLEKDGNGVLCLVLSHADGKQISSWNIPYTCEFVPGFESEEAKSYYTAFSETVENLQKLVETDPTVPSWAKEPKKPTYTAAEVGAAPAGYGLGGFAVPVPGNNLDTLKANGWYYCADSTTGGPSGYALGNAVVEVSAGSVYSPVHQTLHFGTAGRQPYTIKRYWNNATNSWVDWEWINPPMLTGVEYRTTERYKGKAVYTKLINFGYLPNATKSAIANNVGATLVIRCEGVTSSGYTLPYNYNGATIELCADLGWIMITTNKDFSTGTADIQIWYTKD